MTDRLQGFLVVLDKDIREDDAEVTKSAIEQIKHVARVDPMPVNPADHLTRAKVALTIHNQLLKVVTDYYKPEHEED
jgi:hypothetical protein